MFAATYFEHISLGLVTTGGTGMQDQSVRTCLAGPKTAKRLSFSAQVQSRILTMLIIKQYI